jgi:hypothetical protein
MDPHGQTLMQTIADARVDASTSFIRLIHPFDFGARTPAEVPLGDLWIQDEAPGELELLAGGHAYLENSSVLRRLKTNEGVRSLDVLGGGAEWRVVPRRHGDPESGIPIELVDARIALFPTGVGFVCLTLRPQTTSVGTWATALHALRFTDGLRSHLVSRRRTGPTSWQAWSPIDRPSPSGGWASSSVDELFTLLVANVLKREPLYVRGRALTYSALFVDELSEAQATLLRHAVGNHFHGHQPLRPPPGPAPEASYRYAGASGFVTTTEGSAFVGVDLPPVEFFRQELPLYVSREYGLIFLLVAHERFALLRFLEAAVGPGGRRHRVEHVRRFGEFAAARHALHAIQRERHRRYSASCSGAMGVRELYDGVEPVMSGIAADAERSLQNVVVWALAVPTVALGWLGINIAGVTGGHGLPLGWAGAVLAVLLGVIAAAAAWGRR